VSKAPIKSGEINQDDRVRLACNGQPKQLIEQPLELGVVLHHLGQPHDRVARHIERQRHSVCSHARASRPEELRGQAGVNGLHIFGRTRLELEHSHAQALHQFRRQPITARFTRNEHERARFHAVLRSKKMASHMKKHRRREANRIDAIHHSAMTFNEIPIILNAPVSFDRRHHQPATKPQQRDEQG
jgi:hypothetical protein